MKLVLILGFFVLLSLALRQVSEWSRRNIFGRKRTVILQEQLQDFCHQQFAVAQDVPGLEEFPEIYDEFEFSVGQILMGARPEIYNLITDQPEGMQRAVFDYREPVRGVGGRSGASFGSVFLLSFVGEALPAFGLSRNGFGNANLWGEDPNIDVDVDGGVVFSQSYFLTGPDRESVKSVFDKSLVSFFRSHMSLFTSGSLIVRPGGILFQHQLRLEPEDINLTLDKLSKLLQLLIRDT